MGHDDALADIARGILTNRRSRSAMFPADLFGEWAWEVLLLLFIADAEGRQMTGWMIAHDLACSPSLLSRWIKHLSSVALIIGDGSGDLNDLLTLSPSAITSLEHYLTETANTGRLLRL